jgi:Tfp pilus assembly protein PilN
MFYVAFILALSLACVAGLLYFYALFLEGRIREQRRRIAELERACAALSEELRSVEAPVEAQQRQHAESWPELIDENNDYPMS